MYKEAQAATLPSPIGGIIAECSSQTHDYPSARPTHPFTGGGKKLRFPFGNC
jgi:hypothetical protein